jgi:non-canonical purine NTP pyrophosphatase (RdgB/HAM1 family)
MELLFVTSNPNKLREASRLLGRDLLRCDLEVKEIQAIEVKDVVREKAKAAYGATSRPVLVEDTGLYIRKLGGFPGALVKWVLGSVGNEGICRLLKEGDDRSAYAETGLCVYDGKEFRTFFGRVDGSIAESPRGTTNFGWDPVFQPEGRDVTFAEMPPREKDSISMRAIAFAKLKEYLDGQPP